MHLIWKRADDILLRHYFERVVVVGKGNVVTLHFVTADNNLKDSLSTTISNYIKLSISAKFKITPIFNQILKRKYPTKGFILYVTILYRV